MTPEKSIWDAPLLSPEDERLIHAYVDIGRAVDELPYTADFDRLIEQLGLPDSEATKHSTFIRLLRLRKMGRLPRVGRSSAV